MIVDYMIEIENKSFSSKKHHCKYLQWYNIASVPLKLVQYTLTEFITRINRNGFLHTALETDKSDTQDITNNFP